MGCFRTLSLLVAFVFADVGAARASDSSHPKCDVLFVAYDMGDLNALKIVAGVLETRGQAPCFLTFAQARTKMLGDTRLVLKNMGEGDISEWGRTRLLRDEDLATVKSLSPKVVVVGMASALQGQLLNTASHKAFAFYDNFDPIVDAFGKGKEYVQAFLDETSKGGRSFTYLVPSDATGESFDIDPRTQGIERISVGQPVLEEWDTLFETVDRGALRQRLAIAPDRRVIVFAGGYDETYEKYVTLFVETMKDMVDTHHLEVLITYHPKPGGVLERRLVEEVGSSHIRVIETEEKGGVATNKLATLADVFMCHKSSLGPQAISQGLPMVYVADPNEYTNLVIEKGLAQIAGTKVALRERLEELFEKKEPSQRLAPLGLPKDKASDGMACLIEEALAGS